MKPKIFIILGCALAAITVIIAAVLSRKPVLKIGVMPDVDSVQVAVAASLCENTEIILFTDAFSRTSAFRNGSVDVCISDMLTVSREISGGRKDMILTATSGDYCLVSRHNTLSQAARSVGVSTGTVIEFAAHRIFDKTQFNKVPVQSITARYSALISGSVDSCILPEPYASMCAEQGYNILSRLGQNDLGVLVLNQKSVKNKPQIENFMRCFNEAADICNLNPNGTEVSRALSLLSLPSDTKLPTYKKAILPSGETVEAVATYLLITDNTEIDCNGVKKSFWNY